MDKDCIEKMLAFERGSVIEVTYNGKSQVGFYLGSGESYRPPFSIDWEIEKPNLLGRLSDTISPAVFMSSSYPYPSNQMMLPIEELESITRLQRLGLILPEGYERLSIGSKLVIESGTTSFAGYLAAISEKGIPFCYDSMIRQPSKINTMADPHFVLHPTCRFDGYLGVLAPTKNSHIYLLG